MGRWQCCLNWSPDSSDPTKWFVQSLWIQRRDFSSGSVLKHWSIPIWKVSQVFGRCSATAAGLLQLRVVPVCVLVALGSSSGMYLHRLCHRKRMMCEGWGWSAGIWAWTCWMLMLSHVVTWTISSFVLEPWMKRWPIWREGCCFDSRDFQSQKLRVLGVSES